MSAKFHKNHLDMMLMLGLIEAMDQLAMANTVSWCGHVLKREDRHV